MSGKKGMPRYGTEINQEVITAQKRGASVFALSKTYGISRYAIQSWCGLHLEVEVRRAAPLPKGRPKTEPQTQAQIIRRLQMENDLLRNFLSAVGRG